MPINTLVIKKAINFINTAFFILFLAFSNIILAKNHGNGHGHGHNGHGHHGNPSSTNNCTALFEKAIQTHSTSSSKKITFKCNAKVISNPDNILPTLNVKNPSGSCDDTCPSADCIASGTPAGTINAEDFKNSTAIHGHHNHNGSSNFTVENGQTGTLGVGNVTDYNKVTVKQGATLNFTNHGVNTIYHINKLELKQDSIINFISGDFWIDDFSMKQDVQINIVGAGTTRIYINKDVKFDQRAKININNPAQNPAKQLLIYGYKKVELKQDAEFVGFIYSQKKIVLHNSVAVTGAILGQEVELKNNATVTYDPAAVMDLDLGDLCDLGITHFVINHGTDAIYCVLQEIVITAHNSFGILNDYTETVVLDTGSGKGTWSIVSGYGNFSDPTANDGLATYTFSSQDQGTAIFGLYYSEGPDIIDIETYVQSNQNIRDDDTEGSLTFSQQGFVITENPLPEPITNPPVNFNKTLTAGISDTLYLTAFGLVNGSCNIISNYNGNKTINFWQNYINPTTGTLASNIDGNVTGTTESGASSHNLNFVNGKTNVSVIYRDTGKIKINLKDQNDNLMRGATDRFVVKPAKFVINIPNNPGANDANGSIFTQAGENFTAQVTVQDNDGNTTPNYGNEISPAGIIIYSSTLVAPNTGRNGSQNDGAIGNGTTFSKIAPGVFQGTTFSFDEVGIIRLTAAVQSGSYLNTGNVSGPETGNIGRFTPYSLAASGNTPIFNSGSIPGGFTYLNQKFKYNIDPLITLTAKEKSNGTTENYTGDFWKIGASNININYSSNSPQAPFDSSAAESNYSVTDNGQGKGTVLLQDGGGLKFSKINGLDIQPFNTEIQIDTDIADSDGITYPSNPFTFGGTNAGTGVLFNGGKAMYQGRIFLGNNFGSGQTSITVPFQVHYYSGTVYELNTSDSSTLFNNSNNIILTPNPSNLIVTPTVSSFNNGIAQLSLSPAPVGISGFVDVQADLSITGANLPYLQHDWPYDNTDGIFDDNPQSRITYGVFEGEDNIIYIREITD